MYDSLLPLKTLFGALFAFIAFLVLFVVTVTTSQTVPLVKWFTVPLMIFIGISMIVILRKINTIVTIKEKLFKQSKTDNLVLSSCPEYWVKETVTINRSEVGVDSNEDVQTAVICRNYFDNDGTPNYVGGSGNGDTNSKFVQNFAETPMSFQSTISSLQSKASYIESFNEPLDLTSENLQTSYVPTGGEGVHVHHIGPIVMHDLADDKLSHDHVIGEQQSHIHETVAGSVGRRNKRRPYEHGQNWINSSPNEIHPNGVEINLTRLNDAENKCELSKKFHWTEAYDKCI